MATKGRFINTTYKDSMDSIISIHEDLIKNPFYLYNDKKGSKVKYYNQNTEKSTLDKGSGLSHSDIGEDSSIRFNVIDNLFIYQFSKAELNFVNGDFGLESDEITGESYILPNTIIPYDGDYFEVSYIKDSSWLFRVINAQKDTLENGSNVYKINWILDRTTNKDILKNVVEYYEYINVREGTNIKSVVKKSNYEKALRLEDLSSSLKDYFIDLFYSDTIQTFLFEYHAQSVIYDPFVIEFIIRNSLLERDGSDYIHIDHKINNGSTFAIEYKKSLYYAFEKKDIKRFANSIYQSQVDSISTPGNIFDIWNDKNYYKMNYRIVNNPWQFVVPVIDEALREHILNNIKYEDNNELYKNIFIKFFNNEDIYEEDFSYIDCIDYGTNREVFYHVILLIFCIDYYIKYILTV